jgi:molybdenum cofactor cytidylyltransferase
MIVAGIGIVVLAAGQSRRFGAVKLAATIDGQAQIRRAASAALAFAADVVVVTGAHRAVLEPLIADLAVRCVFNAQWSRGMSRSIACGVAALPKTCMAAIILPADQALVGAAELQSLCRVHADAPERIVAARFGDVLGPPCLFPRAYFNELIQLDGDQGARALLLRHADRVVAVPMPGAAVDIDRPEDFAKAARIARSPDPQDAGSH